MKSWIMVGLFGVGCSGAAQQVSDAVAEAPGAAEQILPVAVAKLEARSGSAVAGEALFEAQPDGAVKVIWKVSGAVPGEHAVHIHEKGDCSAPDAASAGPHWNPANVAHGGPHALQHHAGDLGNIQVGADGSGEYSLVTRDFTLAEGTLGALNRAVIMHASADDMASQPAGNAGARVACGLIQLK